MCGIVGIASQIPIENRDWLIRGRDAIAHRGPDDAGLWWASDASVGFGHRRLSIIDLSPAGYQPMSDASGELCIVFNGEIYNFTELRAILVAKGHTFRSQTDTEVVLNAYREWGAQCVVHLNGMFAFALYDARMRQVFLARDRAGEKPLFYYHANGALRFASELKALLADATLPRHIDRESLDCYLGVGFVPADRCIFSGFNKLSPAHAAYFNLNTGQLKIWRYWQPPALEGAFDEKAVDEVAMIEGLEVLLADAVRRQLVADVPVGILLSGGVDSSLVTAMAVRASTKVKTFTIRFPGHGKLDETEHARLIARHFETEHIELEAQPISVGLLRTMARQFDEPTIDSSLIPTFMVSELVRQHCSVALGGDGGDELFGGYSHYSRLLRAQNYFGWIPRPIRSVITSMAEHMLPVGLKGRNWMQGLDVDMERGVPLVAWYFDAMTRRRLMRRHAKWPLAAEDVMAARVPLDSDLLQRATRLDFLNYLPDDILVKVDRASMLNSLEVRAPFLDYRVVEFAFGKIPPSLKATARDKKILLKRLAARVLPPQFDRTRKQGFSIPLGTWLKAGPFRKLFYEVLQDARCPFDRKTISGLLKGQDRGRNNGERLFGLVLFELWRQEYDVSF